MRVCVNWWFQFSALFDLTHSMFSLALPRHRTSFFHDSARYSAFRNMYYFPKASAPWIDQCKCCRIDFPYISIPTLATTRHEIAPCTLTFQPSSHSHIVCTWFSIPSCLRYRHELQRASSQYFERISHFITLQPGRYAVLVLETIYTTK
jgi:hypothetical protein